MNISLPSTFEFTGGQSEVGELSPQHPNYISSEEVYNNGIYRERMRPVNATLEIYRSEAEGKLGVISTRFIDKSVGIDKQFADVIGSQAAGTYVELCMIEAAVGEESETRVIAEAIGIDFRGEDTEEARSIAATTLEKADDINLRLAELGIVDRKVADFEANAFSAMDYMEALSKGEIIIAKEGRSAIHDRLFHLMGHALISPEVFALLREKGTNLKNAHQEAIDIIGGRPFYEFDGDEPRQFYETKKAVGDFMGNIDFDIPNISFILGRAEDENTRPYIQHRLNELLDGYDNRGHTVEDYTGLVEGTLEWTTALKLRAAETQKLHR